MINSLCRISTLPFCCVLLCGALGAGVSSAVLSPEDQVVQTLLKGMDYQTNLLRTFEGYGTMIKFGPSASGEGTNGQCYVPESAELRFYAADRDSGRWLVERKFCLALKGVPQGSFAHVVEVCGDGFTAWMAVPGSGWLMESAKDSCKGSTVDLMNQSLFLLSYGGKKWHESFAPFTNITVSEEVIDNTKCLRIDAVRVLSSTSAYDKLHFVTWVDVDKGFSVRKWAHLYLKDDRVIEDHIGHAYDFKEYEEGLWLPQRTKIMRSINDGLVGRALKALYTFETFAGHVNKPLSEDLFQHPVFSEEFSRTPYKLRLANSATIKIECEPETGDDEAGDTPRQAQFEEITIKEIRKHLFEEIEQDLGSRGFFIEPLPNPPET